MNILILGGTRFVGRAMTRYAANHGHTVTVMHRGGTPLGDLAELGVKETFGDRSKDLGSLEGSWDAVIDACGYKPVDMDPAVSRFAGKVGAYLFVSTVSVYTGVDGTVSPIHREDDVLAEPPADLAPDAAITGETYGPLKVLCERIVDRGFRDKAVHVRPTIVIGPEDYTERYSYWIARLLTDGPVLRPRTKIPRQVIDADDLAAFSLHLLETGQRGKYNVAGPAMPISLYDLVGGALSDIGSGAQLMDADEAWLIEQGVEPWSDLPLWLAEKDGGGSLYADPAKSVGAGLRFTPMADSNQKIAARLRERIAAGDLVKSGMTRERELEIIERLKSL